LPVTSPSDFEKSSLSVTGRVTLHRHLNCEFENAGLWISEKGNSLVRRRTVLIWWIISPLLVIALLESAAIVIGIFLCYPVDPKELPASKSIVTEISGMISEMGVGVVSWILVSVITGVLYPIS
jgi:hypothetical protein